jgi:thioredoxin-like negative regulator of GroEL
MQEITEQQIRNQLQKQGSSFAVYLYTPFCGTCKVGEKMLSILLAMDPTLPLQKCNIHYAPQLAKELQIESVPCLVVFKAGKLVKKEYAMRSVDFLYQLLQTSL